MKYILFAVLVYIGYQFVFRFVIPVYLTTRKLKKEFKNMHEHMRRRAAEPPKEKPMESTSTRSSNEPSGDYIDFEEI